MVNKLFAKDHFIINPVKLLKNYHPFLSVKSTLIEHILNNVPDRRRLHWTLEVLFVVEESCALGASLLGVLIAVAMEIMGENWRATEKHTHRCTVENKVKSQLKLTDH